MVQGGPFSNDDKTVMRPSPGGRITPPQFNDAQPRSPQPAQSTGFESSLAFMPAFPGKASGSLLELAAGILSLAARLRISVNHTAVEELKQKLAKQVSEFERQALASGLQQEQVRMASYALCTFLDELIQNTPWGAQSNWGHQSLLILFHKEAWGGERFFQIVEHLVKQPAQNLDLIEFCHALLSFGFEGKYRVMAQGLNDLEKQRLELYQLIQRVKGDAPIDLSPRWRGLGVLKPSLASQLPLWVLAAVAGGILMLCYLGFAFAINAASDPTYKALLALSKDTIAMPVEVVNTMPAMPVASHRLERFKPLLAAEIDKNMVEVVDDSIIRVRNSFASGSDQVKPEFIPMLQKIAQELAKEPASILVTGHTDDKPIVSARFPSNWHLSQARAKHVLTILQNAAPLQGSARAEGRADGEPLEPNDTPEHRAFNRRVDILIK